MTNKNSTVKVYEVREMSTSDNPADQGPVLKRFVSDNGWELAADYRDKLYRDERVKSYVTSYELV